MPNRKTMINELHYELDVDVFKLCLESDESLMKLYEKYCK